MTNLEELTFTGCKHLDYSDNYAAKKEPISVNGETKSCWHRPVLDETYPALVQFCKLRGRMNHPEMCLCEETKQCSDYNEIQHKVKLS